MQMNVLWRVLFIVLLSVASAPAQGPLAPTNAPGLIMKTLDQVEARIPISSIPVTLSNPGSYYLTASLSMTSALHGISINSDNVTVDLNGFSLNGASSTHSGIFINSLHSNIVVRNGTLIGWGWEGVDLNASDNGRVEKVQVSSVARNGIRLGVNGKAIDCQIMSALKAGVATYEACEIRRCQSLNIRGHGFDVGSRGRIEDCQAINCGTNGIVAGDESMVRNCLVVSNQANGISLGNRCQAINNYANNNAAGAAGAHILCRGNQNRVEGNELHEISDASIRARGGDNIIADNIVLDTLPEYDLSTSNSINILIHKLPVTLAWPCMARLAGSLKGPDGVFITASGVTLDLGGYTLESLSGADGVMLNGNDQIAIRNGVIRGWSNRGINGNNSDNCLVEQVRFISNGNGLYLARGARVTDCEFTSNHVWGAYCDRGANISGCVATGNDGSGIRAGMGSLITRCTAWNNNGDGIVAYSGSEIADCTAMGNGTNGLMASEACWVHHNNCTQNQVGLLVSSSGSRIEDNNFAYNSTYGLQVLAGRNIVIRNTAGANASDYAIAGGCAYGVLMNVTAGGAISNSNPWVNFSF